ncbi:hypothetical protein [Streptomyces griseoviridis]|uniref:hypothetical protein n=1 Tax=Streptomyces griseoviridis TaxID=45398 RepID=UPI00343CFEE9
MGFAIGFAALLIAGALGAVVARRRERRPRTAADPDQTNVTHPARQRCLSGLSGGTGRSVGSGRSGRSGRSGLSGRSGFSDLDAEAEANRWLIRLGASLVPPDAPTWSTAAGETAGRELTEASECHREARVRLAGAHTAAEYAEVTRTAREGLAHVRAAREALGVGVGVGTADGGRSEGSRPDRGPADGRSGDRGPAPDPAEGRSEVSGRPGPGPVEGVSEGPAAPRPRVGPSAVST